MELTSLPHKIYKQGNYVVIKPHNQPPKRRISSYTYIEEIDGNVRFAYGPDGIWLAPSNFLKADGTAWGATAEEAVANYLATNTVMENSSRANVPIPMAVRVVNFSDVPQGGNGSLSTNVNILNWKEKQEVTVDKFPDLQKVQMENLPDVQKVQVENPVTSVDANVEFPEVQKVEVVNPTQFPDSQNVKVTELPVVNIGNWPAPVTQVKAEVAFPAVQTVHVDNPTPAVEFPPVQDVRVMNPITELRANVAFPDVQKVVVQNPTPAVQFPAIQRVDVNNPVTEVTAKVTFPAVQDVRVLNPVTEVKANVTFPVTQPVSGNVTATINGTVLVQIVPTESKWQFFSNSFSAVNGIDLAPAQAGKRNHLVGIQVAGLVPLLSGDVQILDGNTVIYQFALAANATLSVTFDQPLFSSPGNALRIRCAVTGLNMRISAQGFAIAN